MSVENVENKVVVIVGGTSGIGARTAELFTQCGAYTVLAGRRQQVGEQLASMLGSNATFQQTDVTVESEVEALTTNVSQTFGRLDALLNCAGELGGIPDVATIDLPRLLQTLALHVGGTALCIKHAAPVMIRQGNGSIVNIASIAAEAGGWTALDYSAAKAAVVQLTRSAAVELGQHGVRVNSISPGPILTGIFGKAAGLDEYTADQATDDLEDVFTSRLRSWQPMPHIGRPDDVARAALWLVSDASSFVNGQNLVVDGGISAGRPASVSVADRAAMANALAQDA